MSSFLLGLLGGFVGAIVGFVTLWLAVGWAWSDDIKKYTDQI